MLIRQIRSAKFLGINLDEHLTSDHVDAVRGKLVKYVAS